MLTSDIIRITNAVFYAYHGVASDEQNLGGMPDGVGIGISVTIPLWPVRR